MQDLPRVQSTRGNGAKKRTQRSLEEKQDPPARVSFWRVMQLDVVLDGLL